MDQLGTFRNAVSKRLYQEDSIDRLNYRYTVWLLIGFAVTLSMKQFVGDPIQCWVPAEFSGGWEQYTENYCFVENTYFVPFGESLPDDVRDRDQREIAYYQWVPFILALEALLFYIPHLIWRLLNWQSGVYLRGIITMACENKTSGEKVQSTVDEIAGHLHAVLEFQRPRPGRQQLSTLEKLMQCGRPSGYYLAVVYLLTKILFIANLIGQFCLLNAFLGTTYTFWGASILGDILRNHDWQISGHFPRVTVCDFVVRKLGNNHRYSVQCVLMINMFSEKIFLFVWWWFVFVVVVTIFNFLWWLYVTMSAGSRRGYLEKLLYGFERPPAVQPKEPGAPRVPEPPEPKQRQFDEFIHDIDRPDVVVIFRLMANNSGEMMADRVCKGLFEKKLKKDDNAKKNEAKMRRPASIEKVASLTNV